MYIIWLVALSTNTHFPSGHIACDLYGGPAVVINFNGSPDKRIIIILNI